MIMKKYQLSDKIKLHFISGNGFVPAEYEDGGWDRNRGNGGRGRGRGRGRGFRGRGRGGYSGPQVDTFQDGGYNQEAPVQGRGICNTCVCYIFCAFGLCLCPSVFAISIVVCHP